MHRKVQPAEIPWVEGELRWETGSREFYVGKKDAVGAGAAQPALESPASACSAP